MSGRGLQVWSQTAASNNTIDSGVNWAEGMAPSAVNDSARAEMASMAMWRDDNNGTIVTTGTTLAYTITTSQGSTANTNGYTATVQFHATNDSSATLARDTAPAANLQLVKGTNLAGGEFTAGSVARFTYITTSTAWVVNGNISHGSQANIVNTANITDNAVTLAKLATQADQTFLGNVSGGTAVPTAVPIGSGLQVSGGALTAPAFPPVGAYKNLSIKVASVTTVTGAADFVATVDTTAASYKTLPAAGTINLATAGAVNALDAGTIASGTWYAIYAIASSTSTAAGFLASTSFTTPLLPSGYTYKARLGAVVTSTSTASAQLMGTWQFGRRAQYVVGLGLTTKPPSISTGIVGTFNTTSPTLTAVSVSNVVPSTASAINLISASFANTGGNSSNLVAPSVSYGGTNNGPRGSNGMVYPISSEGVVAGLAAWMVLEATTIGLAQSGTGGALSCLGWEDNI